MQTYVNLVDLVKNFPKSASIQLIMSRSKLHVNSRLHIKRDFTCITCKKIKKIELTCIWPTKRGTKQPRPRQSPWSIPAAYSAANLGAALLGAEFCKISTKFCKIFQIFGGLVLGCIKTNFCNKICVRQHFSSSTRFASFCTAAISKFSQKIGLKNQQFS